MNDLLTIYKKRLPSSADTKLVYELTRFGCPLRKYIALSFHFTIVASPTKDYSSTVMSGLLQSCSPVLVADVIELLRSNNGRKVRDPKEFSECDFHVHSEGTSCSTKVEKP